MMRTLWLVLFAVAFANLTEGSIKFEVGADGSTVQEHQYFLLDDEAAKTISVLDETATDASDLSGTMDLVDSSSLMMSESHLASSSASSTEKRPARGDVAGKITDRTIKEQAAATRAIVQDASRSRQPRRGDGFAKTQGTTPGGRTGSGMLQSAGDECQAKRMACCMKADGDGCECSRDTSCRSYGKCTEPTYILSGTASQRGPERKCPSTWSKKRKVFKTFCCFVRNNNV